MEGKPIYIVIVTLFALFLYHPHMANATDEEVTAKLGETFKLEAGQSARIVVPNHDIVLKLQNFYFIPKGIAYGLHVNYQLISEGVVHTKGPKETWFPGVPYDFMVRDGKKHIEFAVLDSVQMCTQGTEMDGLQDNVKEYVAYRTRDKIACWNQLARRLYDIDYCERIEGTYRAGKLARDGCLINVMETIQNSGDCKNVDAFLKNKCEQTLAELTIASCGKIKSKDDKQMCYEQLSKIKEINTTSCLDLEDPFDRDICKKALKKE